MVLINIIVIHPNSLSSQFPHPKIKVTRNLKPNKPQNISITIFATSPKSPYSFLPRCFSPLILNWDTSWSGVLRTRSIQVVNRLNWFEFQTLLVPRLILLIRRFYCNSMGDLSLRMTSTKHVLEKRSEHLF